MVYAVVFQESRGYVQNLAHTFTKDLSGGDNDELYLWHKKHFMDTSKNKKTIYATVYT